MNFLETIILGSYVFTGACWGFTFWVYRQMSNHLTSRVKKLETQMARVLHQKPPHGD